MEQAFINFTSTRKDIAIVLINQHVRVSSIIVSSYRVYRLMSGYPTGSRKDQEPGGHIHRGIPGGIGDTEQRPSIRPRKGQRTAKSEETLWRMMTRDKQCHLPNEFWSRFSHDRCEHGSWIRIVYITQYSELRSTVHSHQKFLCPLRDLPCALAASALVRLQRLSAILPCLIIPLFWCQAQL